MKNETLTQIEKLIKISNENAVAESCLQLLQVFNDYDNPIQMDADYVRQRIIKYMKETEK